MKYFILSIKNGKRNNIKLRGDAIFNNLMENKVWGVSQSNRVKNFLSEGDKIIFYYAGNNGKKLLGTATATTGFHKVTKNQGNSLRDFINFPYQIELKEPKVFNPQKSIYEYIKSLSFIKNKDNWGSYLQGYREISKLDFELLTKI